MEIIPNIVGAAEGRVVLENSFQQGPEFSGSSVFPNAGITPILRMNLDLAIVFILFAVVGLSYQQCDYAEEVVPGKEYYVYQPNYPANYGRGTECWWRATAPSNSKIKLNCYQLSIPESLDCSNERLVVSVTGDNSPNSTQVYCGSGTFVVTSVSNRMTIYLYAGYRARGGSFTCLLTTDTSTPPAPPNPQCDCGWKKETRIVGGHETGINEYPMMAALVSASQARIFCGATIIGVYYALTAAHCFIRQSISDTGLLVGEHDISTGKDTNATQLYRIIRLVVHPEYNTVTQKYDIAVVRTEKIIVYTLAVGPVCLPFRHVTDSFDGQMVTLLGWGTLEFGGPTSTTLQEVQLEVINFNQCNKYYNDSLTENQMCTYGKDKDACQSDSGGPVLWLDKRIDRVFLSGIISYGIHCANEYPGVNTRVTSYLPFILQNTPDTTFCVM